MKKIKTNSIQLENGHVIIGCDTTEDTPIFFVKSNKKIHIYNEDEMEEIYKDFNIVSISLMIQNNEIGNK